MERALNGLEFTRIINALLDAEMERHREKLENPFDTNSWSCFLAEYHHKLPLDMSELFANPMSANEATREGKCRAYRDESKLPTNEDALRACMQVAREFVVDGTFRYENCFPAREAERIRKLMLT